MADRTDEPVLAADTPDDQGLFSDYRQMGVPTMRMARITVVLTLTSLSIIALINLLEDRPNAAALRVCSASMLVIVALQLFHTYPRPDHRSPKIWACTLCVQALLTFIPFWYYGVEWGDVAGFLGGSVLLLVRGVPGWTAYTFIVLSVFFARPMFHMPFRETVYLTALTAVMGQISWAQARLSDLLMRVHEARGDIARFAVARERRRFARDLHDLLGYSLSAISLKSEVVHQLMAQHPDLARQELDMIVKLSRQALSDVRSVANGYRQLSLESEVASAKLVLATAGIQTCVDITPGVLDAKLNTVLAIVLREGVTNVLRHSRARRCDITMSAGNDVIRLVISNDGPAGIFGRRSGRYGQGLDNLAGRLAVVGGSLSAGVSNDGRFRLTAVVPRP
ncbi:histidine kinase [Actinoallomurus spadix]|uniref:Signal transduction histidine kinase subgroup 3 dimerisation and phosphoacceptor domain-containing protein n=1 Tax=Actinoallomurus spadix TaxID=79912 RepID=A0ABP3FRS0_9ACTN|nr:histidine kinase [Actinoallomurus spadix]MCO5985386.1 histidine kinase [Actinoallomurus spadix]